MAAAGDDALKGEAMAEARASPFSSSSTSCSSSSAPGSSALAGGARGGYWLAKPPEEITLASVIRAVEGPPGEHPGPGTRADPLSRGTQSG